MTPIVSVIIPTCGRAETMRRCVSSVLNGSFGSIEIIIADDASSDHTASVARDLAQKDPRVKYIRSDVNQGPAAGRNRGAAISRGSFLFFLDDDNIPDQQIVSVLVQTMESRPELSFAAPLAVQSDSGAVWTLGSDFNPWTSMPRNVSEGKKLEEIVINKDIYPSAYSPNAFMVRRTDFEAICGFDPFYRIMFDESDFMYRLNAYTGRRGAIVPRARTEHCGHFLEDNSPLRALGIETPSRAYLLARNRSVFVKRHFSLPGRITVMAIFVPLFTVYYCFKAIRNKRPDIAAAFIKGSAAGIFCPAYPDKKYKIIHNKIIQ